MHFSTERASVNILSGFKTEATASKVEKSASDGILYQFFRSSAKTAQIASCSMILHIILQVDPHLVLTSATSLCCFKPNSICFWWRSLTSSNSCWTFQLVCGIFLLLFQHDQIWGLFLCLNLHWAKNSLSFPTPSFEKQPQNFYPLSVVAETNLLRSKFQLERTIF